jgi:WD40 repeat protein
MFLHWLSPWAQCLVPNRTACEGDRGSEPQLPSIPAGSAHCPRGIKGGGSVAFSPDGEYIVTASFNDKNAQPWEVATGQSLHVFKCDGEVIRVAYSPDGKYILTGTANYSAQLWDPTTGDEIRAFAIPSGIESLAVSPERAASV